MGDKVQLSWVHNWEGGKENKMSKDECESCHNQIRMNHLHIVDRGQNPLKLLNTLVMNLNTNIPALQGMAKNTHFPLHNNIGMSTSKSQTKSVTEFKTLDKVMCTKRGFIWSLVFITSFLHKQTNGVKLYFKWKSTWGKGKKYIYISEEKEIMCKPYLSLLNTSK
jgi:hypothetical protein